MNRLTIIPECDSCPAPEAKPEGEIEMDFQKRFLAACQSLYTDVNRGFDSGSELIGIIKLKDGKTAQFHLSLVSDEMEFLDTDTARGAEDVRIFPSYFTFS